MTADQPLTGDELDSERLERVLRRCERIRNTAPNELLWVRDAIDLLAHEDVPRLVAEVERLRARVAQVQELADDGPFYCVDFHGPVESVDVQELRRILGKP